jgi:hypothetical protein
MTENPMTSYCPTCGQVRIIVSVIQPPAVGRHRRRVLLECGHDKVIAGPLRKS